MSNLFKIKRGATVPTSDVLSAYELGFMTEGGKLYIGLGDSVKMLAAGPSSTLPKAAGNASVGTEDTFARGDHIHPLQTSVSGNAGTATKLETARTIQINLASTSSVSFDGSADITPGVKGILPITNGGTNASTAADALVNLGAASSDHTHKDKTILPAAIELFPPKNATHGGFIDFHYGASSSDYTSRIIEWEAGTLTFSGGINLGSPLSIANGGTGATSAENACSNLGAVKKSGDTMTGTLTNTSMIIIKRDTHPSLYFDNVAGKSKGAVICSAGSASGNGGIILRGWNSNASDYKDLVLTYSDGMTVSVTNGGTGATTAGAAVQNLFDSGAAVTSYPTKPGIYRCIGTNVCTNSYSTLTGYGVLVIFKAVYGMHFYLDYNGTLIYGYSGDTFQQPSSWYKVTKT